MKSPSLKIEIPSPEQDRPAWPLVGTIAVVGFVVGIAWPKLLGVRVGPKVPDDRASSSSASSSNANANNGSNPAGIPVVLPVPNAGASASAAPAASAIVGKVEKRELQVMVSRGSVVSCKGADGESKKGKECGSLTGLDAIVAPKIRRLAGCPSAQDATGKLAIMATVDVAGQKIRVNGGGKSSIDNAESVLGCLRSNTFPYSNIEHDGDFTTYNVAFTATFAVKESTSDVAARESQVAVDPALIRETPRTGKVVAKLSRGTKVKIVESKDGWYRVQFSDAPGEGWVYRSALGR